METNTTAKISLSASNPTQRSDPCATRRKQACVNANLMWLRTIESESMSPKGDSSAPCLQPYSRPGSTPSLEPSTAGLTLRDEGESRIGKTQRLWYINQQLACCRRPHKGHAAGARCSPFTIKSMPRVPDDRDCIFMKLQDLSKLARFTPLKSDEHRRSTLEGADLCAYRCPERPTIQQSVYTCYETLTSNKNCTNPYRVESFS